MDTQLMRSWMAHIQEAYEGETTLKQAITRNLTLYGQEASRMQAAGGNPPKNYPEVKTAADLLSLLGEYVDAISDSDVLKSGPALTLLSRLKAQNPERGAQELDKVAKMPAPDQEK